MIYCGSYINWKISDIGYLIRNLRPIYFEKLQLVAKIEDVHGFSGK
jgi:hypothetical protein